MLALVFPGQGSQSVGMLGELAANHPVVRGTFEEASAALGYDLWQLVASGPAEQLNRTEFTQPAMLTAGIATWRLWREQGGAAPALVAGHSLGEFTALVCAESMDLAAGVRLVRERGRFMQEAVPKGGGAMAAILGLDDAAAEAACAEAAQGEVVEAVNYNAPGQIVIAGQSGAVERAMAAAKARGAKRALTLPVSVPAHSSLMKSAAERLQERLGDLVLSAPVYTFISAVDAQAHGDPEEIRGLLVRQLASPVRWSATVQALTGQGATALVECGPGKVLTGLNRRIERRSEISCCAVEDGASLQAALSAAGSADS
ncbi:MAG TPA: ACP S-malonyltransferase [Steroidobacteraceae bacterium]|nr:ACP S-malonyltransferase [Steroidobacteraceae bacterium]